MALGADPGVGASSVSSVAEACRDWVLVFFGATRFVASAADSGCRRLATRPVCDLVTGLVLEGSLEEVSPSWLDGSSSTRFASVVSTPIPSASTLSGLRAMSLDRELELEDTARF